MIHRWQGSGYNPARDDRMHDFMKHGLFGIFILGAAACALSAISAAVIFYVDTPLFSTSQIEKLLGVGMGFGLGVVTCVLCALGIAALDFVDRPKPPVDPPLEI